MLCYGIGASRYAAAAILPGVTFPLIWFVPRVLIVLISNAVAKSREDFPPQPAETGHWPLLIAALSAVAVAYIIIRKR